MEKLLTVEEVAEHFRVSTKTIYFWVQKGLLKSSRVGGVRRFRKKDVEDFFVSGSPHAEDYEKKKTGESSAR